MSQCPGRAGEQQSGISQAEPGSEEKAMANAERAAETVWEVPLGSGWGTVRPATGASACWP
jgi:hypothetical protein